MDRCDMSDELLHAWADGEAGEMTDSVAEHVAHCSLCAEKVNAATRTGKLLRGMLQQELGSVEPLMALQEIRDRIDKNEQATLPGRFQSWWDGLWASQSNRFAGLAVAMAVGAIAGPLVVWFVGALQDNPTSRDATNPIQAASVVVESVEIEGNAKTVVYQPQGSSTAVVWIDAQED